MCQRLLEITLNGESLLVIEVYTYAFYVEDEDKYYEMYQTTVYVEKLPIMVFYLIM